ncbi:MAG: hypothetical protein NTX81_03310 [Candidatus Bathyarchaeota archaeon]|nr:hypothetical protein [Candidatus Bathyarchaeota archaeon]
MNYPGPYDIAAGMNQRGIQIGDILTIKFGSLIYSVEVTKIGSPCVGLIIDASTPQALHKKPIGTATTFTVDNIV